MKILVANLGSTSFKYRLFDMADERLLARGGVERIGSGQDFSTVVKTIAVRIGVEWVCAVGLLLQIR